MNLKEILADCLNVVELIKPHVRDDGDVYHAQLANNIAAAHGAAVEAEAQAAAPTAPAVTVDHTPVLDAIASLGAQLLTAIPAGGPILSAIEAVGNGLTAVEEAVHEIHDAVVAPPAQDAAGATTAPALGAQIDAAGRAAGEMAAAATAG